MPSRVIAAALLAGSAAGCATLGTGPRTIQDVRCATPPAAAPAGGSLAIARAARRPGTVRIGSQFNQHGDISLFLDVDALEATLAADLVRLLHGVAADPDAGGERLEVRVVRVATVSASAGFFELTVPVRSEIAATARVVPAGAVDPADGAPVSWTVRGTAMKRVAYIETSDHEETLAKAYCDLLQEFAAHAPELVSAAGAK